MTIFIIIVVAWIVPKCSKFSILNIRHTSPTPKTIASIKIAQRNSFEVRAAFIDFIHSYAPSFSKSELFYNHHINIFGNFPLPDIRCKALLDTGIRWKFIYALSKSMGYMNILVCRSFQCF